jgi:hypothetical protein
MLPWIQCFDARELPVSITKRPNFPNGYDKAQTLHLPDHGISLGPTLGLTCSPCWYCAVMEGSDTATLQPLSAGDGLPFPTLRGLRVPKSFDRSREDTRMDETGPLETAKIP